MSAATRRYYIFVWRELTSKRGEFKLSDVQAIDAMNLTVDEFDAILDGVC